jgi:hypothetical protein
MSMNMRAVLLGLTLLTAWPLWGQEHRVVGYLPYYRFGLVEQVGIEQLTHLCLAFANPDAQGNLSLEGVNPWPVVQRAHQAQVKVLVSLAGGALKPEWVEAWDRLTRPGQRTAFIHRIMNYVRAYQLDGVDVDLEFRHVTAHYSGFVLQMRDSLRAEGKLLTAALPGIVRYKHLSDEALQAFDFINLMAYDLTGQFAPNRPGPHSPYSLAVAALDFWERQGVSPRRLVLGLPLYGWDFSTPGQVRSVNYSEIVATNPAHALIDQIGRLYYNGILTVTAKTELAKNRAGGVMLWELGKDAYNEYSLLKTAYHTLRGEPSPALAAAAPPAAEVQRASFMQEPIILEGTEAFGLDVEVLPNPFQDSLTITNREHTALQLVLATQNGTILHEARLRPNASIYWETASFPPGKYLLSASRGERQLTRVLTKERTEGSRK